MLKMQAQELLPFLEKTFPESEPKRYRVEQLSKEILQVRRLIDKNDLRPGATIAGPVLMALSDLAMYLRILSLIGPVPLAVTTNLNINFLRKPPLQDLLADARILKQGKHLIVGDVLIYSAQDSRPVAHATLTYSVPPKTNL